ncbi:terminase small subunit [Olivibacter sp. 47]|uniref:terminase small subunit n=1 Tax=Olivibacter sp. 47 TaxID=3056486 RepID=UPI0025A456D2|nr:terminase small subunit [Olivibacter sp. 47]MDM8174775.1 terminase small subunit [Olivibacter sp. 47]
MENKGLTTKETRFIEEYLKDFNAAQAAIRAGYSANCAKQIGYENLTKPYLKTIIDRRLKELSLSAEETAKMMSDIARSSLNDYLVIRKVERRKKVKKKLSVVITEKREEMMFEQEFAALADLNPKEAKAHEENMKHMQREILRLELELKRNPKAYRIEYGDPELVDDVQIDLVKLAKDKEFGKIKSLQWSEFGPKVELYAADAMLDKIARVHGMYKDSLEIEDKNKIDPDKLSDDVIKALLAARKQNG